MSHIKNLWFLYEHLDSLNSTEFEDLIFDVVQKKFKDSKSEKISIKQDLGFDIQVIKEDVLYLFEIKKRRLLGNDEIYKLGHLWKQYQQTSKSKIILVVSGTLTKEAIEIANEYNIEIWDVYTLYSLITPELEKKYFYGNTQIEVKEKKEDIYIRTLQGINAGGDNWQKEWSKYQKLVCDILEYLFSPPLESPRFEMSDLESKNRRDIIFENPAENGFWKQIKNRYSGDYIVVDAKNYKDSIEKRSIIELAHYLKPYGCGLFGLVVSRIAESESSFHARKEQWVSSNKMIISLTDNDLIEMLGIKKKGGKPEELIRKKIADFRMKL